MKVILPASGFAKRNPGQNAKELMVRGGRPLIEFSFSHLLETNARNLVNEILIITRKDKVNSFREWLEDFRLRHDFRTEVEFLLHEPAAGAEWPMTILASESRWENRNLVLLPDTELAIEGGGLAAAMNRELAANKSVWGLFEPAVGASAKTYGVVDPREFTVVEKPAQPAPGARVWGCFGFQKDVGAALLRDLEASTHSHIPFALPKPSATVRLARFNDLSRTENLIGFPADATKAR